MSMCDSRVWAKVLMLLTLIKLTGTPLSSNGQSNTDDPPGINNETPVILKPKATDSMSVRPGVPIFFSWTVEDDMPSFSGDLKVTWFFGDGTVQTMYGLTGTIAHIYERSGGKSVRVTVVDVYGGYAQVVFSVNVEGTPRVKDVKSRYCHGKYGAPDGQHVYFLAGVKMPNLVFDVDVETNACMPDKAIASLEVNDTSYSWPTQQFQVAIGEWPAGSKINVVAVAKDGTRSIPFRVNFDVVPLPPLVTKTFYAQQFLRNGDLTYTTPEFDMDVFKGIHGVVDGCPLPGKAMEIQPTFKAEAEFKGDGTLTVKVAGGKGVQFNEGAADGGTASSGESGNGFNDNKVRLNDTRTKKKGGKFGTAAGFDFGLDVSGEVVSVWDNSVGTWAVNSGCLGLSVSGSFSSAPYPVWPLPPVYLRADVSAALEIGVQVRDLGTEQGWKSEFVASSEGFPEIKGVLGCGIGSLLALEGYVGVSGKFEFRSPPTVCTKLGVEGKIGAQIVVVGFANAPFDIWSGSYWIVGGDNRAGVESPLSLSPGRLPLNLADLDTRQFKPMRRDYVNRRGSLPLAVAPQSERMVTQTGGSETVLMADGYHYPEPAVVAVGTTNHALYLRDNVGRSAENRTELVEVNNAGTGWSAPAPVWDDGTGDFSPQVASLSDGTLLAVWANESAPLASCASLDDALQGLEIAVGERNPSTGIWTCRNLSSNAYLDHSPMLATMPDGNAIAAWIRNRDLNPTGTPEKPNRILFSRRQGCLWSEEDCVAENLGTVTYCDLAYNGTQAAMVFSMDGDGDLSTQADQELYGCTFDGSQWGAHVRMTSNMEQDTRPYVRYDVQGRVQVMWYRGGEVLSATGLELADTVEVGELGIGSSAQDFKLVTGPAGQMAVLWQDAGAASAASPDPCILNYDQSQRVWGRRVRLLDDAALERGFSGTFGQDGRLRLAYSKVAVGESNGVPFFGAVDLCMLDHPVGPDPAISECGISISTNLAALGEDVLVSVTVENRGDLPVTNLSVCVYEGNPAAGGMLLGGTQRVSQVLGGTSAVVAVVWTLPKAASNIVLYAVADPTLETDDRNRGNNTATLAAMMPDVALRSVSVLSESKTVRLVNARVMNQGSVPVAAGTRVTFRRGSTDGALLAEDMLGPLTFGTNGVVDAVFRWDMGGACFTSAFEVIYIAVDPSNAVAEIEERNNTAAVQVMTSLDTDGDGLLDGEEQRQGTRVDLADTDGDLLSDDAEVRVFGTNPLLKDTDGDGLSDFAEVLGPGTNPLLKDTDGDGMDDDKEQAAGTDPNSATDVFKIVEADGHEAYVMSVVWNAKAGGVYRVEAAPAISGPWGNAPDNAGEYGSGLQTAVSNGVLRYCDTQSGVTNRFYRVFKVGP